MSIIDIWKFIVIFNLRRLFGNTNYIVGPRNTAVDVGERVEMECWADSDSIISEWSVHKPIKEIIFANWKEHNKINNLHFGIVKSANGSVVLYKNSTDLKDAGIYTCAVQKELKQPQRLSAQLIVFETKPMCDTNLSTSEENTFEEGTHIWMKCTVSFRGSWTPSVEWRLHEDNGKTDEEPRDLTDWVRAEIVPNANVSSTLTIGLNASSKPSYIWCKIYFKSDGINQSLQVVTANNTPDYNYIWKSPVLTTLPKIAIQTSSQLLQMATTTSTKDLTSTLTAIYLVAGVAILFGITGSMAAIILCLRLRRKHSAAIAELDRPEPFASQYDLIPYAITDGYDSIEEVDEKDDILFPNFPPRQGPLPEPGYAPLMPDEPKPPGVYSRMDHKEKSVEGKDKDVEDKNLPSDINLHEFKSDQSMLSAVDEPALNKMRGNSYLALTTEMAGDTATTGDEIPSAYLKMTDDSLQFNTDNSGVKSQRNEYPNSYLEIATNSGKELEDESAQIPSAYLRITDESWQESMNSNAH